MAPEEIHRLAQRITDAGLQDKVLSRIEYRCGDNLCRSFQEGGFTLKPAKIKERIGRKWENLYYQNKFKEPRDYSKEITDIVQCAKWSNRQLQKQGYSVWGDAWTRSDQDVDKVISGYDGMKKPEKYSYRNYKKYVLGAADNVKKNLDVNELQEGDIIGLYFRGSPNYYKAFTEGKNGEAQTHTGHVVYRKGKPYVAHNVHGDIKLNKAKKLLGKNRSYGIVSVYRPKKRHAFGGELELSDRIE